MTETTIAPVASTTAEPIVKHSALYTGEEQLGDSIPNSDGFVSGEYWELDNVFYFQPTGTTLAFVVSDEDIRRVAGAVSGSNN